MTREFITDIGLEVHVELDTRSKMFCGCAVVDATTAEPNISVCEICLGMPGVLPVINKRAIEFAVKSALALNCTINETSIFARKNYFYPDLPKGYQISQYERPLAENGNLEIQTDQGETTIHITRVHMEEDTGKLTHVSNDVENYSLVDLNRAGVPLMEIVSEPDMHSVADVRAYSHTLRRLLRWIGVTSGDMEKGSMRFEANVSMRPAESDQLGTRVEIKNLNSFKAMERAIAFELEKQQGTLLVGGKVAQQTLGWNDAEGFTTPQRSKEEANDYRYFPEPDLPPLIIDAQWLEEIKAGIPELPSEVRTRTMKTYKLNPDDIDRLLEDRHAHAFFEECLAENPKLEPRAILNWMLTDLYAWLNQQGVEIANLTLPPRDFTDLVNLVENGTLNQTTGKEVLNEMLSKGGKAETIVKEKGLVQISDLSTISRLVSDVIRENPLQAQSYRDGKKTIANWLFGQVMKKARGQANPRLTREELFRQLDES